MKAQELTAEEMELVKAYQREYARNYRKKNPEKCKLYAQRYALKKAKEAAAAGTLNFAGNDTATD